MKIRIIDFGLPENHRPLRSHANDAGADVYMPFDCTLEPGGIAKIPLGFGLIEKEDVPWFSRGILIGVGCIPVGSIVSGLLLQIPVREVLWNSLPVLLMSVLIVYGMCRIPEKMISIMEKLRVALTVTTGPLML